MALISSASVGDKFATGTTGQRPGSPQNGDVRFNTSLSSEAGSNGHIEFYANGWVQLNVRPTPGNGKIGYTAGTGCTVTGSPGKANQASASTQKVDVDKNTFLGWYKPPPYSYPIEAHFGVNFDSKEQKLRKEFNVKSVTRVQDQCDTWRKHNYISYRNTTAMGKWVVNVGTNDTASYRVSSPDFGGNCGLPPGYRNNQSVCHHRTIGIDYVWPDNMTGIGYMFN